MRTSLHALAGEVHWTRLMISYNISIKKRSRGSNNFVEKPQQPSNFYSSRDCNNINNQDKKLQVALHKHIPIPIHKALWLEQLLIELRQQSTTESVQQHLFRARQSHILHPIASQIQSYWRNQLSQEALRLH